MLRAAIVLFSSRPTCRSIGSNFAFTFQYFVPCVHLLALVYGCFPVLRCRYPRKTFWVRKGLVVPYWPISLVERRSLFGQTLPTLPLLNNFTSIGLSLTSVTPQRALPSKASLKQKGFNAVVRNEPLFKPDMPILPGSLFLSGLLTGNAEGWSHSDSTASSGWTSCSSCACCQFP